MAYIINEEKTTYRVYRIWIEDFAQHSRGDRELLRKSIYPHSVDGYDTIEEAQEAILEEIRYSPNDYRDFYRFVIEPIFDIAE